MKTAFTAVSTSILLAGTMSLAATASADGHETVESLKAELNSLNRKLDSVTKGRAHFSDLLEQRNAETEELEATHAAEVAKAKANGDSIADAALAQVRSALAERDAARAEATAEKNKNDFAEIMLKKAQSEASANGESAASLMEELEAAKAANAKLALDMESVINGRTFIEKQAASARTEAAGLKEELASSRKELKSAAGQASYNEQKAASAQTIASQSLARAEEENAQLKEQLAGFQEKTAMAEAEANWSSSRSATLASQLSYLSEVKVASTSDNRVNLSIGGSGMFRIGGTSLSDQGKYLLEQVGQALKDQADAIILVTGHTDNIPTGDGSRFENNLDLSNRRAEAAMNHMGNAAGIDFGRMSFTGIGDSQPIASNATPEGRQMNRRVEIILSAQ